MATRSVSKSPRKHLNAVTRVPRAARGSASVAADPALLLTVVTFALVLLGVVMILSASFVSAFAAYGSSFLFFKKQLIWALIGTGCFLLISRIDYHKLRGYGYLAIVAALFLLLAVLIPGIGAIAGGSARWLQLGPFSFQPSEFAKLALVLFGADVFSRKKESKLSDFSHVALPMIPVLVLLTGLVLLQPDLGTTLLLGAIGMGMLFLAGTPMRYLVPVGAAGAVVAVLAAFGQDYRRARILAFLDPWADPFNTGYQTIQSLIALGSGGWFGVGLGASRQKWLYVPNAHTDFIFSIFGEEAGLIGTLIVLSMFTFIAYLGVRVARQAPDRFGMLVAGGITIWIAIQALVNLGAVTAALPITGVPLPLVSFGGTSLVITLIGIAILVNIAGQGTARRRDARSSTS